MNNSNNLEVWYSKLKGSCLQTEPKKNSNFVIKDGEENEDYFLQKSSINSTVQFNSKFNSFCSLITYNSFLVSFLLNHIIYDDKLSGFLFLISSICILTCSIFSYPSYKLTRSGNLNFRIIKWVYFLLVFAIGFYYLKEHIQFFSSTALAISIGFKLFKDLPYVFPNTFTYNELILVCTIGSCSSFVYLAHIYKVLNNTSQETIIIEHSLAWLFITIFLTKKFSFVNHLLLRFLFGCVVSFLFYFIPVIHLTIRENPFIWLFFFIFKNGSKRVLLFSYWILLFSLMIMFITLKYITFNKFDQEYENSRDNQNINLTTVRKIFHFLICLVYLMGFVYDTYLLYLCSYGMLILLIIIETIRYMRITKIGEIIQEIMSLFLDEKDCESTLILSHIYLLVGLSFPLWISKFNDFSLPHLSGLITVGIGDSFASIIGSRFGKHKIPGTKKSIEGSISLILSQLIIFLILIYFDYFQISFNNFALILLNLFLTSILEAFTKDNDNFILPLISYPFLCFIK